MSMIDSIIQISPAKHPDVQHVPDLECYKILQKR